MGVSCWCVLLGFRVVVGFSVFWRFGFEFWMFWIWRKMHEKVKDHSLSSPRSWCLEVWLSPGKPKLFVPTWLENVPIIFYPQGAQKVLSSELFVLRVVTFCRWPSEGTRLWFSRMTCDDTGYMTSRKWEHQKHLDFSNKDRSHWGGSFPKLLSLPPTRYDTRKNDPWLTWQKAWFDSGVFGLCI